MSSLSNLPYGKILDYWYERLAGHRYRGKFILTKMIEVYTFKANSGKAGYSADVLNFPNSQSNNVPSNPKTCVVIPAFVCNIKDRDNLMNLFASLESQTKKPDSVILVDDCSPISYETNEYTFCKLDKNSGPAKARNIGKSIALKQNADIIAFIDSDCIADPDWLETITQNFLKHKEFNILSGNTVAYDAHWFGIYHDINGTLNGRKIKGSNKLLYGTTANLAVTSRVAEQIDFNEQFPYAAGEDIEFCFKANMAGFAITHIPQMIVKHNFGYEGTGISNFKKFRKLFKKYGSGEKILLEQIPNYYAYFDQTIEIPVTN